MHKTLIKSSILAFAAIGAGIAAVASGELLTGNAVYLQTFDNKDAMSEFTIVDADGDGTKWGYDDNARSALYKYSSNYGYKCSDYLVTPAVELKASKKYKLGFRITGQQNYASYSGEFSVVLGKGDNLSEYTEVVPLTDIDSRERPDLTYDISKEFTVPADGSYSLAFRMSNSRGRGCDRLSVWLDDISIAGVEVSAPAPVSNLTGKAEGIDRKATINFTTPTMAIDGSELQSISKVEVRRGDVLVETIEAPSTGVTVSVVDENPTYGSNIYTVTPFAANGTSGEESSVTLWIGPDTPTAVRGLEVSRDNDGNAVISWEKTLTGVNGGNVDAAALRYTVRRRPGNEIIADGIEANSWVDGGVADKSRVYTYAVVAHAGELKGETATSGGIFVGKAYETPYVESFGENPMSDFTVIDANGDGKGWRYDSGFEAMNSTYGWEEPSDDWLLTPTIRLEGGWAYTISYGAASSSDNGEQIEKMSVAFGRGGVVSGFEEIIPQTEYNGRAYTLETKNFNVQEDGDYQFGFHLTSDASKWGIWLDSIRVQKFVYLSAPDSVTDIRITPAEKGALKADISFRTPSQTAAHNPLSQLTKVEIYNTDAKGGSLRLVSTVDNPAPGAEIVVTDNKPSTGFNVYYVKAFNSEGTGISNASYAYVGEDVPFAPTDLVAADNLDGTVALTWNAPAGNTGVYGGYVNPQTLCYNVYRSDGLLQTTTKPGETTAVVDISYTGNQAPLHYNVYAVSKGGQSADYAESNELVAGGYVNLPFRDSFVAGWMRQQWFAAFDSGKAMVGPYTMLSSDDDSGCYAIVSWQPDSRLELKSGKIRVEDATNPRLSFYYYTTHTLNPSLDVIAITPDNREIRLTSVEIAADDNWHRVIVETPQLSAEKYVRLCFRMAVDGYSDKLGCVAIDNIDFREMLDCDIAAENLSTPYKVTTGQNIDATLTVTNNGLLPAEDGDYTVELFVNNENVASIEGEALQSDESKKYSFSYKTRLGEVEGYEVYAKVNYISDLQPNNDVTETNSVVAQLPGYPAVDNLDVDGETLVWDMPASKGRKMIEDFEDYEHGLVDRFGEWQAYDFDGRLTLAAYLGGQGNLPNKEKPISFQIFNPVTLGLNLDYNQGTIPHSGNQYAVSWGGFDNNDYKLIPHDDMLVSPELSGEAQTVTFWIRSMYARYDRCFDLLTSSTTNESTAFDVLNPLLHNVEIPIDDENDVYRWNNWTKYEVELPAGTKYFAIRAYGIDTTTPGTYMKPGYLFMLDDVVFSVTAPEITGYNVYGDDELVATLTATQPLRYKAEAGHRYNVTVLYADGGESVYSNDATLKSGVSDLSASGNTPSVSVDGNRVTVTNIGGRICRLVNMKGVVIGENSGNDTAEFDVVGGQYIVSVGNFVQNVVVR